MNKQTTSNIGQQAADFVNDSRASVAGGIEEVADRLDHVGSSMGKTAATFTSKAKDSLDSAADYVRETDVNAMVKSATRYAKSNPMQMLIGALVVGFVAGRVLRRN